MTIRLLKIVWLIVLLMSVVFTAEAEDLNCMLCHKHFGLSGFDNKGIFKIHYINEKLNLRSPHASIDCIDCHEGIEQIPHEKIKKVDCTIECHLDEPSSNERFSHKPVADLLKKSAHSKVKKNGVKKKYQDDYPDCSDCHEQPLYRTLAGMSSSHKSISERSIARCKGCHDKENYAEKYFLHVASRLQRQSNPIDRIETCAVCHGDKDLIERHDMDDVVSSYKETFHYKMLRLGSEKTPDCIDCHVLSAANGHLIPSMKDKDSPTHKDNVGQTCQQSDCHENASEKLAGFQTHVTYDREKYPLQYFLLLFFRVVMTVVLYGFLIIVFLELLRRLFPNFQLSGPSRRPRMRR